MRVVSVNKLTEFTDKHPIARSWVRTWLADAKKQVWEDTQDVKSRYPTASVLPKNWIIFNVKGNDFRMVVQIAYKTRTILIKWIGTHSAYEKIDWEAKANENFGD